MRLVSTAALILVTLGALLTPASAWASLSRVGVRLWSGLLGSTPASVIWTDPSQVKVENPPSFESSSSRAAEWADAALKAGFEPYQWVRRDDHLTLIEVPTLSSGNLPGYEMRMVSATYQLDGTPYYLQTSALLQRQAEGEPALLPLPELPVSSIGSTPPEGIRRVAVGETEAICFEEVQNGAPQTRCTLLLEGLVVVVKGPESGRVERILTEIGRG